MEKSKLIFITALLLIIENVVLWYVANYYYQYRTQETRANSKTGQAEVCKIVSISSDLSSVLQQMSQYSPDSIHIDSMDRINLSYGSETKGFVTAAGVGFIFDQDYKLIHKSCGMKWEPETPIF